MKSQWDDIADMLTEKGKDDLRPGQVLIFDFEGSRTNLRIMRKAGGKVWAKHIELHDPDDVEVVDA